MMLLSQHSHSVNVGALLIIVFIFYYVGSKAARNLSLWRRRRISARAYGTMPVLARPQRDTLFGMDLVFDTFRAAKRSQVLEKGRQRFAQSGSHTIQLNFGGKISLSTIEPENLKTILAVDFKKWSLPNVRKNALIPLIGQGIFTTDGQEWQHSRDMLRPNFVRSQVADVAVLETHVANLINAVPRDGSTVNLSDLFFRLTIDSATELLFGESTHSLTKGSEDGFAAATASSQEHCLQRARMGTLARLLTSSKRFAQDVSFVHRFADRYVARGLARRSEILARKSTDDAGDDKAASERYLFIDELVRRTDDPIRLRCELLNILLAGRDTTASLLTNLWWLLSVRSDVWAKLQAEITQQLPGGAPPSFEQLKNLKYLKATLNEALRLYPVVPFNSRQAVEDTTLPRGGGPDGRSPIFVPKGQRVTYSTYAMHRRRDYYGADADEFRPERWLDDTATGTKGLRPGWEYLPFNGGPRICLGQQYALMEASYTTVRLCQAFAGIASADPAEPWTEMLTLTCVNRNGAKVRLTPRRNP